MATASSSTTDPRQTVEYEDFIDEQIDRTRFHVKTVDLVVGLIQLALVWLGSLLVIVIIDHWVIDLSFAARLSALVLILASSLFVFVARVLPPLFRSINPDYAAQTVERSFPSLKGGLIDFLFFRDRPNEIRENVYLGLRRQAATELAEQPIDSAVDRSPIIRLGYVLVAITGLWVAYILVSPKSPLQTIQRVATPWREIARPSRVEISEVTPGNVDVFRGQSVDVHARVDGLEGDSVPVIEFSSLDGQVLNQRASMAPDGVSGHFVGTLTTGSGGIQQDLEYRVVAGDAVSGRFEVHAIEAPHIVVDRIEYNYPAYTRLTDEIVSGEGDIRAVEGTRVAVHGRANQPIHSSHIEFLPTNDSDEQTGSKQAAMESNGSQAKVKFTLRLDVQRKRSIYRGYRLHFLNQERTSSVDPVEYALEVIPDRRPEVEILTPNKRTTDIPENGRQQIEVRALDPDYQLTRVRVIMNTRRGRLLAEDLFVARQLSDAVSGQLVLTYDFLPSDFDLKDGDVVEYYAVAEDTRHSLQQDKLDPNRTDSSKQYFRIVAADPAVNESSDARLKPSGEESPQADRGGETNEQQDGSEANSGSDSSQDPSDNRSQQPSEPDEQRVEEQQQGQGNESGLRQKGESGSATEQESDSSDGSPGKPRGGSESEQGAAGNQQAEPQNADSGDKPVGDRTQEQPGDRSNGDPSNAGSDSGGERSGQDDEPLPSSGERDGEVVERVRRHMEESGELEEYSGSKNGGSDIDSRPDPAQSGGESTSSTDSADVGEQPPSGDTGEPPTEAVQGRDDNQLPGSSAVDTSRPEQSPEGVGGKGSDAQGGDTPDAGATDGSEDSDGPSGGSRSGDSATTGTEDGNGDDTTGSGGQPDTSPAGGNQRAEGTPNPSEAGSKESEDSSGGESGADSAEPEAGGAEDDAHRDSEADGTSNDGQAGVTDGTDQPNADSSEGERPTDRSQGVKDAGNESSNGGDTDERASDPAAGDPTRDSENEGQDTQQNSQSQTSEAGGTSSGRGTPTQPGTGDVDRLPPGDAANLEYAREATDLVLEYLKDQKERPNQELLEKLGWDKDDVAKFLQRWAELKKQASGRGDKGKEGKRQLNDILRGMGLQSPANAVRRSSEQDDAQRNDRNSGRRTKVPAELLDPFRAFQRALQQSNRQ